MKNHQNFWQVILNLSLITIVLLWINNAAAETLTERIANFPNWENKPLISAPKTDLIYPDWMAGNWNVESTLIDMVAPLAPKIITPGFENNRQYLYQPVNFQVGWYSTGKSTCECSGKSTGKSVGKSTGNSACKPTGK